jgi:hypothetical protein
LLLSPTDFFLGSLRAVLADPGVPLFFSIASAGSSLTEMASAACRGGSPGGSTRGAWEGGATAGVGSPSAEAAEAEAAECQSAL